MGFWFWGEGAECVAHLGPIWGGPGFLERGKFLLSLDHGDLHRRYPIATQKENQPPYNTLKHRSRSSADKLP